jgi:hypothetical protein
MLKHLKNFEDFDMINEGLLGKTVKQQLDSIDDEFIEDGKVTDENEYEFKIHKLFMKVFTKIANLTINNDKVKETVLDDISRFTTKRKHELLEKAATDDAKGKVSVKHTADKVSIDYIASK